MTQRSIGLSLATGLAIVGACSPPTRDFGTGGSTSTSSTSSTSTSTSTSSSSSGTGGQSNPPHLVMSVPANGDMQASLSPEYLLYFDRPMSYSAATGKISLTSAHVTTPVFSQVGPCPDGNADCIAGIFPMPFLTNGNLAGGTMHTITVDKSLADPNGNTLGQDIVVSFTTFAYNPSFFNDSTAIPMDAGGLDYDPASQSLFLCGDDYSTNTLTVRRIPVPGGVAGTATTYDIPSLPSPEEAPCYGLDIYDATLYLSHTYGPRLLTYSELGVPSVTGPSSILGPDTSLAAPDDTLSNIHSVVPLSSTLPQQYLFGFGLYYGAAPQDGVIQVFESPAAGPLWSIWKPSVNLYSPSDGTTLARGVDLSGVADGGADAGAGVTVVYLASGASIFKIRAADATILNTFTLASKLYDPQLRVDAAGRLYVADGTNITVYDTSGTSGFTTLATRGGLGAGRFGISEQGSTTTVYYISFRSSAGAIVGTTTISF